MRSRVSLIAFLLVVGSFALPHLAHAGVPFFGPIIPTEVNRCAGSFGLLITVFNNVISLLLTLTIVFVAPLMIAYAGFLYLTNSVNPSGRTKANEMLTHVVVGLVLAFAGYLIVAALMAALYNPTAVGSTWAELVGSRGVPPCIELAGSLSQAQGTTNVGVTGVTATGVVAGARGGLCPGAAAPANLLAATANSPYPLTQTQANVMSCIANWESSCGTNTKGAATPGGNPTFAFGMFQVVAAPQFTDPCHNLNIPACSQAAGWSGNLDCRKSFTCPGGRCSIIPSERSRYEACERAAANIQCSAQAAGCFLMQPGGGNFHDWVADPRAGNQATCIVQYNK